jgi:hypothetical protein
MPSKPTQSLVVVNIAGRLDVIDMRKNVRESQNPPIIYLPSSGGFGGSRLAPEVSVPERPAPARNAVEPILSSSSSTRDFYFAAIVFKRMGVWLLGKNTRTGTREFLPDVGFGF